MWLTIFTLLFSFSLYADITGGGEDCITPKSHQLEDAMAPLLQSLKSENNKLFNTLFSVLKDIKKYEEVFNKENDKFKLSYTFYILKSFADLEEQSISSDDINSVLSIIKEKYDFEIPEMAFSIINRIGSIEVEHNSDGSKSIRILSKNKKSISIDLTAIGSKDKDTAVKLKRFTIEHNAEIRFEEAGKAQYDRHMKSFFSRSKITSKKDLITKDEIENIKKYINDPKSEIQPVYVKIDGMRVHFDLKGEDIDKADLRGGALLPQLTDSKGKEKPNFYIGLENISYGILSLDAELPM